MSELGIVVYPDSRLSRPSDPVDSIGSAERKLGQDMVETMYRSRGLGLAAPQVGAQVRIAVLDINPPVAGKNPIILVNPTIIRREGELTWEEGCLSIPDFRAEVQRNAEVVVRALNLKGEEIELTGRNLLAVVLQHELDHLDGTLLLDRVNRLKKHMYVRKIKKMQRQETDGD